MLIRKVIEYFIKSLDTWPQVNTKTNDLSWIRGYSLISPKDCKSLIETAKKKELKRSYVGSQSGKQFSESRNSYERTVFEEESEIILKIKSKLELLTSFPKSHFEEIQVVRYKQGEEFKFHHDYLYHPEIEDLYTGKRLYTLILYLNEGYQGGETEFPKINLKVTGKQGKAILFKNYILGERNINSGHIGHKLHSDEKWVAVTFVTEKPQFQYL